jgi:hypothetical protein
VNFHLLRQQKQVLFSLVTWVGRAKCIQKLPQQTSSSDQAGSGPLSSAFRAISRKVANITKPMMHFSSVDQVETKGENILMTQASAAGFRLFSHRFTLYSLISAL